MDAILKIAERHGLRVIEDCAHKHGGEWNGKKAGSIGDIGSFSFQLSKLMTAGEGGALTTSDPQLWERLDTLRNCGRRPEQDGAADKGAGIYGDEGNFIQSGNYRSITKCGTRTHSTSMPSFRKFQVCCRCVVTRERLWRLTTTSLSDTSRSSSRVCP